MKKKLIWLLLSVFVFLTVLGVNVYHAIQEKHKSQQENKTENTEKEEDYINPNGTLYNVWIEKAEGKEMKFLVNGNMKTIETQHKLSQTIERVVGDLVLKDGKVIKVNIKPDKIKGKVLVEHKDYIELEEYGKIQLGKGYKVYATYKETVEEAKNTVLIGSDDVDFIVADGKICAALITNQIQVKNIRVLIKDSSYENCYHDSIGLTSDSDFTILYGKKKKSYKAGKKVTIKQNSKMLKDNNRLKITTVKEDGKITITSVKRSNGNPSYRGTMEIEYRKGNGLTLINELSMEEYLYSVIGSEMPISYGVEALKVQAVCARSYAYKQLFSDRCKDLGAHVDDSVSYQVYNNVPEDEITIQAVDETKGKVMQYKEEVVSAYYFSTSSGHTANANDVWPSNGTVSYLTGREQVENGETLDLDNEKSFKSFLENEKETYDSSFAWYRWKTNISGEHLKEAIDKNLSVRYKKNKEYILTLQKDGTYKSQSIQTIGKVEDIQVLERGVGGILKSVKIVGSKATIKVLTEYNIRVLLAPLKDTITRKDKTKIEGMAMMPSGFFYVTKEKKGKNDVFQFQGGGYGHGVGMSQNGVKTMVDEGKEYEAILKHYYPGIELAVLY